MTDTKSLYSLSSFTIALQVHIDFELVKNIILYKIYFIIVEEQEKIIAFYI